MPSKYIKKGWNPKSGARARFKEGIKHPMWKGGHKATYHIRARKIMEKHLKRKLDNEEVIHHLDHNRKNNDINNLYLFSTQREHVIYHHMKIRIVKESLNLIGMFVYKFE